MPPVHVTVQEGKASTSTTAAPATRHARGPPHQEPRRLDSLRLEVATQRHLACRAHGVFGSRSSTVQSPPSALCHMPARAQLTRRRRGCRGRSTHCSCRARRWLRQAYARSVCGDGAVQRRPACAAGPRAAGRGPDRDPQRCAAPGLVASSMVLGSKRIEDGSARNAERRAQGNVDGG